MGKVSVGARPSPSDVLSRSEMLAAVEGIFSPAGRFYLDRLQAKLKDSFRALCKEEHILLWKPRVGPGEKRFDHSSKRHPSMPLDSSRTYVFNRVSSDERRRIEIIYKILGKDKTETQHKHLHLWSADDSGKTNALGVLPALRFSMGTWHSNLNLSCTEAAQVILLLAKTAYDSGLCKGYHCCNFGGCRLV